MWSIARDAQGSRFRDARISADGDQLLFSSARASPRTTTRAPSRCTSSTWRETGSSACPARPAPVRGDCVVLLPAGVPAERSRRDPDAVRLPRNLSADGSRVFFETDQALVSTDTNAGRRVHVGGGGARRSPPVGPGPSEFIDASRRARRVLHDAPRLVGPDVDDQVDVYDARVGGGLAEQEVPPECVGDRCQATPTPRPTPSDPAPGSGNAERTAPRRAALSPGKLSAVATALPRAVALRS